MSAETFEALEKALAEHIADDSPESPILTGWVMQCTTTSADPDFIDRGMTGFVRYFPSNQSIITTLGIVDYMSHMMHLSLTQHEEDGE